MIEYPCIICGKRESMRIAGVSTAICEVCAKRPAIWSCKVGEVERQYLPDGADLPMREAVRLAYREITGHDVDFLFSGWDGRLTKGERAVVVDDERRKR